MLTRAQARTLIRAYLTDAEKQIWGDAVLDLIIQTSIDELMSEINDDAEWFKSLKQTLTTSSITSPGYIDLSSAGPLTKRFYRVQSLVRNNQEYGVAHPHDSLVFGSGTTEVASDRYTYHIVGSQLWMFPLDVNCSIELRYNFFPAAFTSLAETATIDWPDGSENVFIYDTLLRIVDDTPRLQKYSGLFSRSFDRMLNKIKREYVGPKVMYTNDDLLENGGT